MKIAENCSILKFVETTGTVLQKVRYFMGKKKNIGLLVSELENDFTASLCNGAISAAKELDFNIFIFPGMYINPSYVDVERTKYDYQHNVLFSYAGLQDLDVLLVDVGTICTNISDEEKKAFLGQFSIPVITIASRVEGYPSIRFNNVAGLADGIQHLLEEHGCQRIGFVSGPKTSDDANERLQVYRLVLEKNGIAYDEERVVYGNFSEYVDDEVRMLLDKNPDLDAVVFANDMMALGGYRVFRERGLKIGKDIVVMGFDDAPCATVMEPNLTTVKADAAELGYHAVVVFQDLLSYPEEEALVDSIFIPRKSCGCNGKGFQDFNLKPEDFVRDEQFSLIFEELNSFLFERNKMQHGAADIKDAIARYIIFLREEILKGDKSAKDWDGLSSHMKRIVRMELKPYTDINKVFALFDYVYNLVISTLHITEEKLMVCEMYKNFYKDVINLNKQIADDKKDSTDWFNRIATMINRDILNFNIKDDSVYHAISDKLISLNYKSFYLCLFDKPIIYKKGDTMPIQERIHIPSYMKDAVVSAPAPEKRDLSTKGFITDLYPEQGRNNIVIVSVLYSAREQYGLLLHEIQSDNMNNVYPINSQISSAISTLELLKNKDTITAQLEESLKKIKESNAILDELSKSDELTHIYNRRGFLTTVQYQIVYPSNKGKSAMVIFADMNNLKIINDKFGHEEGDYSLKLIANILKEALPNGIVGRFGGDEFAAFTLLEPREGVSQIRDRIKELTEKYNDNNTKEFYVSMSVGTAVFKCNEKVQLKDLMDRADVDLYLEKKHKRNNILKN